MAPSPIRRIGIIPWLLDAMGVSASANAAVRGFGVFRWVEFRAVLAVVLAFVAVVACAPASSAGSSPRRSATGPSSTTRPSTS